MSDPSPLDAAALRELRERLTRMLAELEESLAQVGGSASPVELGLSIGRVSRVDALQQQQMALARRRRAELQRAQVRAALGRIDAGTYGPCALCEEEIDAARLRVRPEAPLCRGCEARRDTRG